MIKITISLHDGTVITTEANYSATDVAANMNDPKVLALHLGQAVLNKNIIKYIVPVPPTA